MAQASVSICSLVDGAAAISRQSAGWKANRKVQASSQGRLLILMDQQSIVRDHRAAGVPFAPGCRVP